MDNMVLQKVWQQGQRLTVDDLSGCAFTGENAAHTFEVSGKNAAGAVAISGTIAGKFLRSDNVTVPLTGTASGGVASITLTDDCYVVPGRFIFSVYANDGTHNICIYCGVGNVLRTDSGEYEGGEIITDVTALINAIETAVATIPADYSALLAAIAPTFSASTAYAAGGYVWYDGTLYKFTADHAAGSWTGTDAVAVALGTDLGSSVAELKSATNKIETDSYDFSLVASTTSANGWRLKNNGFCEANPSYNLYKYAVTAGAAFKIVSDDKFQWQTVASVPTSGTSNRIGSTYGAGEYILVAPGGATYLIVSTPSSGGQAAVYGASAKVDALETIVEDDRELLGYGTVYPVNRYSGVYTGVIPPSSASGSDTENETNSTTDFINAEYADKIYVGQTTSTLSALTAQNPVYVTEYDANKGWLYRSGQYPAIADANGKLVYSVQNQATKYVRVTLPNTIIGNESGKLVQISVNISTVGYIYYSRYFAPYSDFTRIVSLEGVVDTHVIDCWGDSRTEMIAGEGTSYCDYLQALLGSEYNVCNYGISSQSSGMCAARLGSNEVFVTLTNNQIPATGEVQLTDIKCSSGNNRNLYAYSATAYMYGFLNGVPGRLSRSSIATYDNVKFLRDSDGSAVRVVPRTKIVVPDAGSKHHLAILWWGKNDFDTAANYVVSGIIDNYTKAVKYLGHKKFIILGETCSLSSAYETGGASREKLDTINTILGETYPDNFIDINAWLSSEDALTSVGLTPTSTDEEYIAKGWPCYQLMVYSTNPNDAVHPNEYGRQAVANKIFSWMQAKGWI